jgi:DNA primase
MMLAKDEIKTRVSLGEIVQRDLGSPVRRSGLWLIYFCPFHANTRTPALGVNVETETFKCFSCQVQGDLFTWRMLRAGESFPAALRYFQELVEKQGYSQLVAVKNHPKNSIYAPPSQPWQQRGWTFLQYAQQQLWQNDAGLQFGLDELFRRGLQAPTILTWGWAIIRPGSVMPRLAGVCIIWGGSKKSSWGVVW